MLSNKNKKFLFLFIVCHVGCLWMFVAFFISSHLIYGWRQFFCISSSIGMCICVLFYFLVLISNLSAPICHISTSTLTDFISRDASLYVAYMHECLTLIFAGAFIIKAEWSTCKNLRCILITMPSTNNKAYLHIGSRYPHWKLIAQKCQRCYHFFFILPSQREATKAWNQIKNNY